MNKVYNLLSGARDVIKTPLSSRNYCCIVEKDDPNGHRKIAEAMAMFEKNDLNPDEIKIEPDNEVETIMGNEQYTTIQSVFYPEHSYNALIIEFTDRFAFYFYNKKSDLPYLLI